MGATHVDMMTFDPQPRTLSGDDKKKVRSADRMFERANLKAQVGHYEEAEAMYIRCIIMKGEVLNLANPMVIEIQLTVGNMWMGQHDFARAEPFLVQANKFSQKALVEDPDNTDLKRLYRRVLRELAFLYYLQGSVLKGKSDAAQQGLWRRAEESFRKVIQTTENELGRTSMELVEPLRNLASLYVKTGDFHQSEIMFKRCIGIQLVNKGNTDPVLLFTRQQLAIVSERREQHKAINAVKKIQEAFLIMKAKKEARRRRAEQQQHRVQDVRGGPECAATTLSPNSPPMGYFTPGTEGFKDCGAPEDDPAAPLDSGVGRRSPAPGALSPTQHPLSPPNGSGGDKAGRGVAGGYATKSPLVPPTGNGGGRPVRGLPISFISANGAEAPKAVHGEPEYKLTEEEMDILNCFPMLGGEEVLPPQLLEMNGNDASAKKEGDASEKKDPNNTDS